MISKHSIIKIICSTCVVLSGSVLSTSVMAKDITTADVKGAYTNPEGFVKTFGFCGDGSGAAGEGSFMTNRTYEVKDNLITMNANGNFVFSLSDDGKKLIAADDFTKQWAHEEAYLLDPKTEINCP